MCNSVKCLAAGDYAIKLSAQPMQDPVDPFLEYAFRLEAQMRKLAQAVVSGDIGPADWYMQFTKLVRQGHVDAYTIGHRIAGASADDGLAAVVGGAVGDGESQFMQAFLFDIVSGRYAESEAMMIGRQNLYIGKMRGTSGQGFVDGSGPGVLFDWDLNGAVEKHCDECPYIAAHGPYTSKTLFTQPGWCDTPCLGNCQCTVVREDGVRGPEPIVR